MNKLLSYLAVGLLTAATQIAMSQTQSIAPTLGDAVAQYGLITNAYTATDAGKKNTGLRLVSYGKLYDGSGTATATVWGIRNANDEPQQIELRSVATSERTTLFLPTRSETFIRRNDAQGSATHQLFYQGIQIDVKASNQQAYADGRPVAITLDEVVARYGIATVAFLGNDKGKRDTGVRLTSFGKIYDENQTNVYTVWRIRNASDQSKKVRLKAAGRGFGLPIALPAHTETFVRSDVAAGSATHLLTLRGDQLDVKASDQRTFTYPLPMVHPVSADQCDPAERYRLDSIVYRLGTASIAYLGQDKGHQQTHLRLLSAGKVYDVEGTVRYSVWRIRNASDQAKAVVLTSKKGSFTDSLTIPAHSETFVYGDVFNQSAAHMLFHQGVQIAARSSQQVTFNDNRYVCTILPQVLYAIDNGVWQDGGNWSYLPGGRPASAYPRAGFVTYINGYEITSQRDNVCESLAVRVDAEDRFTKLILNQGTLTVNDRASVDKEGCTTCESQIIINNGKLYFMAHRFVSDQRSEI